MELPDFPTTALTENWLMVVACLQPNRRPSFAEFPKAFLHVIFWLATVVLCTVHEDLQAELGRAIQAVHKNFVQFRIIIREAGSNNGSSVSHILDELCMESTLRGQSNTCLAWAANTLHEFWRLQLSSGDALWSWRWCGYSSA
jgi:hypothetical protein